MARSQSHGASLQSTAVFVYFKRFAARTRRSLLHITRRTPAVYVWRRGFSPRGGGIVSPCNASVYAERTVVQSVWPCEPYAKHARYYVTSVGDLWQLRCRLRSPSSENVHYINRLRIILIYHNYKWPFYYYIYVKCYTVFLYFLSFGFQYDLKHWGMEIDLERFVRGTTNRYTTFHECTQKGVSINKSMCVYNCVV